MSQAFVVCVSRVVQRYFSARGVNADLLAQLDEHGCASLDEEKAHALLASIEDHDFRSSAPRGTPRALSVMAEKLRKSLGMSTRREQVEAERAGQRAKDALRQIGKPLPLPLPYERVELEKALAAVADERKAISGQPKTPAEFCAQAAAVFWGAYHCFYYQYMQDESHASGFKFSSATRIALDDLARGLYWRIRYASRHATHMDDYEDGDEGAAPATPSVLFDGTARMQRLNKALAKAAKADSLLQTLIGRAHLAARAEISDERSSLVQGLVEGATARSQQAL